MIVYHDRINVQQRREIVGFIDRAAREIHGSARCAEIARERAGDSSGGFHAAIPNSGRRLKGYRAVIAPVQPGRFGVVDYRRLSIATR